MARDRLVQQAARDLWRPRMRISTAERRVPSEAGLYAIYASREVWRELGLGRRPDGRPLYVGKAEESLAGRDVNQHFADGKTGSSTLRRSLATLLRSRLKLRAIPRNPDRPADFDRFGLSTTHDARLTAWMRTHLWIAVWVAPELTRLKSMEDDLKFTWLPPLNLDNGSGWQEPIRAGRALMADQARRWAVRHGRSSREPRHQGRH
jgi:hypothetical protein